MENKKVLSMILAVLLLLYPVYTLASQLADMSPNMALLGSSSTLGSSGGKVGDSGSLGLSNSQENFLKRYNIHAPDRKIPMNVDFDLFYGISVTNKEGHEIELDLLVVDDGGFDVSQPASYTVHYKGKVGDLTATFQRVITVTQVHVNMNDLVIVKEDTEETVSSTTDFSTGEKYGISDEERDAFFSSSEHMDAGDGEYYVAPADSSVLSDISALDSLKHPETKGNKAETMASQESSEELDFLSTDPKGDDLQPLDLRYGIQVENKNEESISSYLEVMDDDNFSMEESKEEPYDVEYAIVYQGETVVQLHREVLVLDNIRSTGTIITDMKITQSVETSDGSIIPVILEWQADGGVVVWVDGAFQHTTGMSSGINLRFMEGPLVVEEEKQDGSKVSHDIVGENIHSFAGINFANSLTKPSYKDMGVVEFPTLTPGNTVKKKAFAGADDSTIRSPLLNTTEADLRGIVAESMATEFQVFQQELVDSNTMKRTYIYYPHGGLLNKKANGEILNNKPLLKLEVTLRLVPYSLKVEREVTITNLAGDYYNGMQQNPVFQGHLMFVADTYFDGADFGFSFRDEESDSVYVRGVSEGSSTMILSGKQDSEAHFAGAWNMGPGGRNQLFDDRYMARYGQQWFDDADFVDGVSPTTGLFKYINSLGKPMERAHSINPNYSMFRRASLEGELPKNLKSMSYPVLKSLYSSDIPPGDYSQIAHINGSHDTAYAMQWELPPTPVGESYTFIVEETWLQGADIQIAPPENEVSPAGTVKTVRFSAENTHMFDYAEGVTSQDWDINATFKVETKGKGTASSWPVEIVAVYQQVGDTLVNVTPTNGDYTFLFTPNARYFFDVKYIVDTYAMAADENEIILSATGSNVLGAPMKTSGKMTATVDSLATITSVTASSISDGGVSARVEFNNPALPNPQDPTYRYNTTVKLYDGGILLKELTEIIASGEEIVFTGLALVDVKNYKLVATAVPHAVGTVETTFQLPIAAEATLTYAPDPSYAIISGMPSPLVYTSPYIGGNANFTVVNTPPTALGLLFQGWEDTDTTTVYGAGQPFTMALSTPRRAATLKTTWLPDPSYKIDITFNNNGGTGTSPTQTKLVGDKILLPTESITKVGYRLAGWTTEKDVAGTKWDFTTILNGSTQTITLYALWEYDPSSWDVTIVEAPELEFGIRKIEATHREVPLITAGTVKVKDTYPGNIQDWSLSVSANQLTEPGGKTLHIDALQYFDSSGIGKSIYSVGGVGSPVKIWTELSSTVQVDYQRTFGTTKVESFGVSLNPSEGVADSTYKATVIWTVAVTP